MEKTKHKNFYLFFLLGKETFAIPVAKTLEVLQGQNITEVPNASNFVRGVIHFRGDIIPVVNTRVKFNLGAHEHLEKEIIIVLEIIKDNKKVRLAATADAVRDVTNVVAADIKPVPEIGLKYSGDFLSGMIKTNDSFVMILDVDKIFSSDDLVQIKQLNVENTTE